LVVGGWWLVGNGCKKETKNQKPKAKNQKPSTKN
jgi:hypothetical protein